MSVCVQDPLFGPILKNFKSEFIHRYINLVFVKLGLCQRLLPLGTRSGVYCIGNYRHSDQIKHWDCHDHFFGGLSIDTLIKLNMKIVMITFLRILWNFRPHWLKKYQLCRSKNSEKIQNSKVPQDSAVLFACSV